MLVLLFFLLFRLPVIHFDFGEEQYILTEDEFTLKWIHSVEKEEWLEMYEMDGEGLLLTETIFKTYGAGVPSDGEIISSEDGFVHMRINHKLIDMNLTVSENAQTTIETESKTIPLYELTGDYEFVAVSIQRIPIWQYIGGKKL